MTLTEVANVASGLFMVALGGFVLTVKPSRPGNVAFVLFSVGFGVSIATSNWTAFVVGAPLLNLAVGTAAHIAAIVGLVGMMLAFPSALGREQRWIVWWALGAATMATIVTTAWGMPLSIFDASLAFLGLTASAVLLLVGYSAVSLWVTYTLVAYLFVIAFRVLACPADATATRRQYWLVSGALLLYAAYVAGGGVSASFPVFPLTPFTAITTGLLIGAMLGLAALWLRESARGVDARAARNLALLALALPTLGLVLSATRGAFEVRGVLRTASVAVLAYAILQHQLLGLDVRVRWGISRGTIAGSFIAVFFMVSEAAQQFFGDSLESAYLGIAAAGVLVFAMAPLQRFTERLAEKALPISPDPAWSLAPSVAAPVPAGNATGTPAAAGATRGAETYRRAVRLALKDRQLSHDEEVELAIVAHELGLTAPDATRIRLEVEREIGAGAD